MHLFILQFFGKFKLNVKDINLLVITYFSKMEFEPFEHAHFISSFYFSRKETQRRRRIKLNFKLKKTS